MLLFLFSFFLFCFVLFCYTILFLIFIFHLMDTLSSSNGFATLQNVLLMHVKLTNIVLNVLRNEKQ